MSIRLIILLSVYNTNDLYYTHLCSLYGEVIMSKCLDLVIIDGLIKKDGLGYSVTDKGKQIALALTNTYNNLVLRPVL